MHHRPLLLGLAAALGLASGLLGPMACDRPKGGGDPCDVIAEIHTIKVTPGVYTVWYTEPEVSAIEDGATVLVEDGAVTASWDEGGVEHRILWTMGAFEWREGE